MSSKEAPNLLKRLERMTLSSKEPISQINEEKKRPCSLAYQKSCCGGKGFRLESRGMFAHAELCSCVKECEACRGRMILVEQGLARPCRKPNPKFIAQLFNEAKIPSRYTFAKLDDFDNNTGNGSGIVSQIRSWERRYHENPEKGLVLYGSIGVGKTFILAALARNFLFKGISVRFIDFFQLVTQIRASYALNESEQKIIGPLMDVDILIIDELGKGRNNEFELTILDQIIMGRYNQNKILIASTNYPLETNAQEPRSKFHFQVNLESSRESADRKRTGEFSQENFSSLESRIDQRIMSRLKETTEFLSLTGRDYREVKGKRP